MILDGRLLVILLDVNLYMDEDREQVHVAWAAADRGENAKST